MVGIVRVIRKIRHMVKSTEVPSAAVPICRQTSLTTSSTDKLNLRLVRASQYLSGFNLSIRHKAGKANIVLDALSRLQADYAPPEKLEVLDSLYDTTVELCRGDLATRASPPLSEQAQSYHITLVEISDPFKNWLKEAYAKDD